MTVDQVIEAYLKYRNKKEALEAEIKDQVKAVSYTHLTLPTMS